MSVFKCPLSHDDWNLASQRLQCVEPNQYHCLLDENGKDTEHCLGKVWIPEGMCPEYNSKVSRIDVSDCDSSSCAKDTYWSNEVYKYSVCLDEIRTLTTDSSPPMTTSDNSTQSTGTIVAIIVPAIIFVIVTVAIICIIWQKKRRRKNFRDSGQHKDEGVPLQEIDTSSPADHDKKHIPFTSIIKDEPSTAALKSHDTKHIPFTSIIKDTPEHLDYKTKNHQPSDADTLEKNGAILYISDDKSSAGGKMNALDSCGRFGKSIFVSPLGQWELEDDISLYLFRQPLDGINSAFDVDEISDILKDMYRQTTHTPRIYFVLYFNTEEWRKYGTHLSKYDFFKKAIAIKDR